MTLVAMRTMGTPVTLEINGIVRLARGFTSSMYIEDCSPLLLRIITNCMFIRPFIPSASPVLTV